MPDIIYPLGISYAGHEELRYSLRSLEKYADGMFGTVFIVGEKPEWLEWPSHIPMERDKSSVNGDQIAKIIRACGHIPDEGSFVLMNDDFFLTGEPKWAHPAVTYKPTSSDNYHFRCMVNTRAILGAMECVDTFYSYEVHMPMMMRPRNFEKLSPYRNVAFRTLYGYMFPDSEAIAVDDVKMHVEWAEPDPDGWCFSIDDVIAYRPGFREWAAKKYPKKSRWEK